MLTAALILAAASVVIAVSVLVWALRLDRRTDPIDQAYNTLPAGRPELRVDTATGSHDAYPHMTDNVRHIVTAYCERMWQREYTQEQP